MKLGNIFTALVETVSLPVQIARDLGNKALGDDSDYTKETLEDIADNLNDQ